MSNPRRTPLLAALAVASAMLLAAPPAALPGLSASPANGAIAASVVAGAGAQALGQEREGEPELRLPRLTDSVRVSLISILPGDRIYSVFGHSALRVRDPALGVDRSYNFGTFDFGDSPLDAVSFVGRFLYGDLYYHLSVQEPARAVIGAYWTQLGRASFEQTLAFTREEAQELFRRLEVNALPENRHYQYDFFFDNCATRLLDAVEAVLGPKLTFDAEPPGRSFRRLLDPYLTGARWTDFGMDLGLGLPSDREATAREAAFLPEHLAAYFASGRVEREDGSAPLVAGTERLTGPSGASGVSWRPDAAPRWPSILGWALLAAGLLLTWRDARARRRSRPALDAAFFGLLGVAGLAVAFLWFVSLHGVTDWNLNLAWALPTHLVLAARLARDGRSGGRHAAASGWYLAGTAALAALLLAGIPVWPQDLPAPLVPLLLLIGVRAGWLARARLSPRASRPGSP